MIKELCGSIGNFLYSIKMLKAKKKLVIYYYKYNIDSSYEEHEEGLSKKQIISVFIEHLTILKMKNQHIDL